MADDPAVLLVNARQETRDVDEADQRDVEAIAGSNESRRLGRCVDIECAGEDSRLLGDDADAASTETGEPDDDVLGPAGLDLEKVTIVDDRADHLVHVVGLRGIVRDQAVEARVATGRSVGGRATGRIGQVVLRQEREDPARRRESCRFVGCGDVGDAAPGRMGQCTAQALRVDVFVGDGLHQALFGRSMAAVGRFTEMIDVIAAELQDGRGDLGGFHWLGDSRAAGRAGPHQQDGNVAVLLMVAAVLGDLGLFAGVNHSVLRDANYVGHPRIALVDTDKLCCRRPRIDLIKTRRGDGFAVNAGGGIVVV